jgi:signal transduction histidine kinase
MNISLPSIYIAAIRWDPVVPAVFIYALGGFLVLVSVWTYLKVIRNLSLKRRIFLLVLRLVVIISICIFLFQPSREEIISRTHSNRVATVLIDTSRSMEEKDAADQSQRLDAARALLAESGLLDDNSSVGETLLYQFDSDARALSPNDLPSLTTEGETTRIHSAITSVLENIGEQENSVGIFLFGLSAGAAGMYFWRRKVDNERSHYLSFFGHELGGSLNGPTLTAKNLAAEVFGPVSPELEPWMKLLISSLDRFSDRVRELGDWARLEFGRDLGLDMSEFKIGEILESTFEAITASAGRAEIEMRVDHDPAADAAWGDAERLRRVVAALLDAGLREVPRGKWISTAIKPGGRGVVFEIAFPYEFPDGFDPNSMLERKYLSGVKGDEPLASGVGLWVLRETMRAQGGELELRVLTGELRLWLTLAVRRP